MAEGKSRKQRSSFYLGDLSPNFQADSSKGPIDLYKYLGTNWGILFYYPDDFAPVATTELAVFAQHQPDFEKYDVKLLALSTTNTLSADNNTYKDHSEWVRDVEEISGTSLDFPIVHDKGGILANLYHVLDEADIKDDDGDDTIRRGLAFESRTIFIIGPQKHFRLILTFPATVGVSATEILRLILALQTAAKASVRTPANWIAGQDVIIPRSVSDEEAKEKFGDFTTVKPYLRLTSLPLNETVVQDIGTDE